MHAVLHSLEDWNGPSSHEVQDFLVKLGKLLQTIFCEHFVSVKFTCHETASLSASAHLNTTLAEDNEDCSCLTLSDFCTGLGSSLAAIAPDVTPLCAAVGECCRTGTTNSDFNLCFEGKGLDVSSLMVMIGGGADTSGTEGMDLLSLMGGMPMPTDLGSAANLLGSLTGMGATAAAAPATTAAPADEEADAEEEAPAPSPAETGTSG